MAKVELASDSAGEVVDAAQPRRKVREGKAHTLRIATRRRRHMWVSVQTCKK